LKFAGVLDGSNNILPIRDDDKSSESKQDHESDNKSVQEEIKDDEGGTDTLSLEIPVGDDRKVLVRYPRDLSSTEATKVGNVLNAVVA
jgi:hypothetical protein